MSNSLDEQSSTNYKEAFSLFDKRGTGRVSLESLGDLLRACGQNPTLAEISDLEKSLGGDFDFDAFSRVLSRPGGFRDPGEPEEYCRGFQVFDKDMTGVIGVGQLRYSTLSCVWWWWLWLMNKQSLRTSGRKCPTMKSMSCSRQLTPVRGRSTTLVCFLFDMVVYDECTC